MGTSTADEKSAQHESAVSMDHSQTTPGKTSDEQSIGLDAHRIETIDVDNYHGLTLKTVLVLISINLIGYAQLINVVASGAFARDIAKVVGGAESVVWISQAIVIVTVVTGPLVSQAADYWGRKWFLVILTGLGFVGSMIIARATSMAMVIGGQVILALAYGSQPLLYAVVSEILPRRYRPVAQGITNAVLALGGITGIVGGSALVSMYNEGFRYVWYLIGVLLLVSALICAVVYNPPLRPLQTSLTTKQKLQKLDWVAYVLVSVGIVLFTMGLSWAQSPYPWTNVHVLAPLLLGGVTLIGLVVHQTLIKKDGLFHHDLFKRDRNFAIALFVIFVDGMAFFAVNNYLPFEVSVLWETDKVKGGLRFAVVFFGSIFSSLVVAIYSAKTKSFRTPTAGAFVLFTIFFGLMAAAGKGSGTAIWGYSVLPGLALGGSLTCLISLAQLSAPPQLIAISSGLMISIRSLGGSVGLAVYTSTFADHLSEHLGHDIAAAVLPLGFSPQYLPQLIPLLTAGDAKSALMVPGVTPQVLGAGFAALQHVFIGAFRTVWIAGAVLSFIAAFASCFFVNPRKDMNMHVDAALEE